MEENTFLEELFDEIGHTGSLKMENILLSFIRIISFMWCVYHVHHVMSFFQHFFKSKDWMHSAEKIIALETIVRRGRREAKTAYPNLNNQLLNESMK